MKLRLLGALSVAALAGCAQIAAYYELSDLAETQVFLREGRIIVGQEPLLVRTTEGRTSIVTWNASGDVTIVSVKVDMMIKPSPKAVEIPCKTSEKGDSASCEFSSKAATGVYSYKLRVRSAGQTIESDPTIMLN